ncbi:recombinase family protein [Anaeromassilibacillus sp. Marseille-P3371]|uniref:recombinase family protein n=1 Tax=Anaeromassilibacillus sp. Marseille-P3371 TaxID=1944639 RepID=UPI000A1C7C77|nr:recombinase family protein [Anaeromassilibacillus sp. Marseille-P3371]
MPQVKVIQPIAEQAKKLRVAAYARVSSDSADQMNSFATQVDYYTGYIRSKEEWEFAGLYADEAVSGTTADKRSDFQRLLTDCRAGKIDRILVKSISRFARNTIDCIQTVRELGQLGISVEFEKEDIDTGKMGSEMLLSILGSAAQEESLSISKNLKWSYRRRMKSGDFITCSAPIGYILKNKTLIPNPQEVPIVEYIFNSYLAGKGIVEIASELTEMEIRNKDGDAKCWRSVTILNILKNEKYIGDALVQKRFTTEELPFQRKQNHGELPQYYIKNSHQGIIPIEVFEAVQKLLKQRSFTHAPKNEIQQFPLSKVVKCGLCGSTFYRKPKNQSIKWICYQHLKGKELCPTKAISQDEIYQAFLRVYNKLLDNRDFVLKTMLNQLLELQAKTAFARPDIIAANEKISELVKQNHSLTRLQTKGCIDSAIFIERSNRNNQKIEELRRELRQLQGPDQTSSLIDSTKLLLDLLEEAQPMLEFEPSVFKSMIKQITAYPDKFCFHLINGLVLDEGRC